VARRFGRVVDSALSMAEHHRRGLPCVDHDPFLDAFIWSGVTWAKSFILDVFASLREPVDHGIQQEWESAFLPPLLAFGRYLRPLEPERIFQTHRWRY
jgi:hypothetical protein